MAKSSTARVARRMARKGQDVPPVNSDSVTRRVTKLDNISRDDLIADVRSTIDAIIAKETDNIKANQKVAYDLMLYREKMALEGVAPTDLTKFADPMADTKALTAWRTSMAKPFIGTKPKVSRKTGMTQATVTAKSDYDAKRALFDMACNIVVVLVNAKCNSDNYSEELGCFAVPGSVLIPRDDNWTADYDLRAAMDKDQLIPLANKSYFIRVGAERTKYIRSSVAQLIAAWKSKPKSDQDDAGDDDADTTPAERGANQHTSIDMPAWKAATKSLPFTTLLRPFWDNLAATRKDGWNPEDYQVSEWNDILNIAQALNSLIQLKADKDKAKAAASENVVSIRKAGRKSA